MTDFGKTLVEATGLNNRQLAKILGVSAAYIGYIVQGKRPMPMRLLAKLMYDPTIPVTGRTNVIDSFLRNTDNVTINIRDWDELRFACSVLEKARVGFGSVELALDDVE